MKTKFSLPQLPMIILCLLLMYSLSTHGSNYTDDYHFNPTTPTISNFSEFNHLISSPAEHFHLNSSTNFYIDKGSFLKNISSIFGIPEQNQGIIPEGESIQGIQEDNIHKVPLENGIFILIFLVILYAFLRSFFYKKLNKKPSNNKQLLILLLCLTGLTKGQITHAQETSPGITYADEYYLVLNYAISNNLTAASSISDATGQFGTFQATGGRLRYTPQNADFNAGVDFCTINTTSGLKKIAVVVFSPRRAYVGYEQNDGDDNIFDMANAMAPIGNLPINWRVSYPSFRIGSSSIIRQQGLSLSVYNLNTKYLREVKLYVDNQLKKEYDSGTSTAADLLTSVYSVTAGNRRYAIVDKRAGRGSDSNRKRLGTAPSGTSFQLIENYSNSSNYGRFYWEGRDLYYESNPDSEGYGMDMQAISISGNIILNYAITVAPIDKAVERNGWTKLESEDIIKGLPRNYSIRYTYWNNKEKTSKIDNIKGSLLEAAVFDIPLSGAILQPGDPGHPGGNDSYNSQTYWVEAELFHNIGTDGRTSRAKSDALPLFCYERKYPAWLTKENYENNLIEIVFENPTFSVCPEKSTSLLKDYDVETDIEVRVMAYKMKEENGNIVRDYDVLGFDLTSIGKYTGYYDANETQVIQSSLGKSNDPYHRYKVASEKSVGFPHFGANNIAYTSSASYGTRKDDETMALYFSLEIDPTMLWGNEAAEMAPIILPAQQGEVLIKRGICGELNDVLRTKTTSLIYRQDFGGYNGASSIYFNPDFFWDESQISVNVREAVASSTYIYRNFIREASESTSAFSPYNDNRGLPYLDEGEYILTKQTEMHYNDYNQAARNMWTMFDDDHTTPNNKNDGYMMQINAGVEKGTFFDYKMYQLCKGATMTFTTWIKNTVLNPDVKDPIDQIFEIYDLGTNKLLSRYRTGPILNPGNVSNANSDLNAWKQYGFEFTLPISTDSIQLKILNEGKGSKGNDFAIDDIEVRLLSETKIEMKEPENADPCQESEIEVNVNMINNDKRFYAWLYSPTGEINIGAQWLKLAAGQISDDEMTSNIALQINPHDYTVNKNTYPDYPTGYYRFAIGYSPDFMESNCYDISEPMYHESAQIGDAYLWTGSAKDGSWNNYRNWLRFYPDGSKAPEPTLNVGDYPTYCNDVYIPGKNVTHYPVITERNACRNIYFFQEGQIQDPQKLRYKKAFVDYNFGQVDASSPYESENKTDMQLNYSASPNNRGQWYTIASPLKQTVTGDFGFAGKPHAWQMKFLALKDTDSNINYGQWSGTFNDADIELAVNHNAMALLVGSYIDDYIGLNNHKNIDLVDGVIRIPFFNNTHSLYYESHPLHEYNLLTDISYFYFYHMADLQPIYDNPMKFKRKREKGYRFVFEDSNNTPLSTYTYSVPAGKDILIGNPFTSQLDMNQFLEDNESVLASPVYYDFVGSYTSEANQAFSYYVKDGSSISIPGLDQASRYVSPLKSFVISTKESDEKLTITLNYNQTIVTQNRDDFSALLRNNSTFNSQSQEDILFLSLEGKSGSSLLTLSFEEKNTGNAGLLRMKDSKVPSIYAIDPIKGSPNMVQFEGGYVRNRIPLGILTFNNNELLTIKAFNIDMLNAKSISLIDNLLNREIDLKTTNHYTFSAVSGINNRFELRVISDNPTNILNDVSSQIIINSQDHSILISSTNAPIKSVEIVDLLGRILVKDADLNRETATYQLSNQNNTVIVKVLTVDNIQKVQKVGF